MARDSRVARFDVYLVLVSHRETESRAGLHLDLRLGAGAFTQKT